MIKFSLCALLSILLAACENSNSDLTPNTSTSLSLLLDVTNKRAYWPSSEAILKFYHCQETPDAACFLRIRRISDLRINPIIAYSLKHRLGMSSQNIQQDPQFRNKAVLSFFNKVRELVDSFYKIVDTTQSLPYSEIFRTITDELVHISKHKSTENVVIIGSDLMERSEIFDSYRQSSVNSEQIIRTLRATNLIPPDLSGIKVLFVFTPKNRQEDKNFSRMFEVYKTLLTEKKAVVLMQPSLY